MQSWAVPESELNPDPGRALNLLLNSEASNVSYIRPSQVKRIVATIRRKLPREYQKNLSFNVIQQKDLLTNKDLPKSLQLKENSSAVVTLYYVKTNRGYRIVYME